MLTATLWLVFFTFLPFLELRFSIPVGMLAGSVTLPFFGTVQGFGLPVWYVFLVCVVANILLAACVYLALRTVVRWLVRIWPWFARLHERKVKSTQERIHKHIERWGWLGLALFIGVPLPGSGVYTGGMAAYGLGMSFKRFMLASVLGVLIAGTAVTLITVGVSIVF